MRRCIVPDCKNTDQSILSHRFPKNPHQARQWADSLELYDIETSELDKFMVCTMHFNQEDYRNPLSNRLNITALPHRVATNPRTEEQLQKVIHIDTQEKKYTEQGDNHSLLIPQNAVCEVVITYDQDDDVCVEVDAESQACEVLEGSAGGGGCIDQDALLECVYDPASGHKHNRTYTPQVVKQNSSQVEKPVRIGSIASWMMRPESTADKRTKRPAKQDKPEKQAKTKMKDHGIQVNLEEETGRKSEEKKYRKLTRQELIDELKNTTNERDVLKKKVAQYEKATNQLKVNFSKLETSLNNEKL